jgi:TonB family protein
MADASAALAKLPALDARSLVAGAPGEDAATPLSLKLRDGGQGELPLITVGPAVRGDVRVASAGKVETPVDTRVGAAASSPDADVRAILEVVRGAQGGLQRCYEAVLRTNEALAGEVVVRWTVSNDGLPEEVVLVSSSLRNAEAEACLLQRVRLLKFTPPRQGAVRVEFPFVFRAAGERS